MHLGPPVIHCLGNTPGRIFPPSGCGNCAQANRIEQTTTSTAKRKNLLALIMTPVCRWLDCAFKGTSRPLLRSRIQCASATTISKDPLFQRLKQRLQGARHADSYGDKLVNDYKGVVEGLALLTARQRILRRQLDCSL